MSGIVERRPPRLRTSLVESSLNAKLLPTVLSVIAGSVDAISFLGLGGLFIAHVTGNLVILAAHPVSGGEAAVAPMLSVPVFVAALGLTRLPPVPLWRSDSPRCDLSFCCNSCCSPAFLSYAPLPARASIWTQRRQSLRACSASWRWPYKTRLYRISPKGAPSTAAMTTNITRFMMDVGDVLLGRKPAHVAKARDRAMRTWPAIVGFAVGCGLGAALEAAIGLRSLALPAGLAFLAVALGMTADLEGGHGP
jgi:uncharacterized membrane protein YoaK (UPF0700 family)